MVFLRKPVYPCQQKIQRKRKRAYESHSLHNLRSSVAKIMQNLKMTVSRNGHRFKIAQPNLIILVSFSSAEDALFNDVKTYNIFRSQGIENRPFQFCGTPGIYANMYHFRNTSLCSMHYYPSGSPHNATFSAMSIEGINSYRTHIYYTWVERDNCGQKALSRSIRTKRKSNPRPSDYESRAQTNAPQCYQILGRIFTIVVILGKS